MGRLDGNVSKAILKASRRAIDCQFLIFVDHRSPRRKFLGDRRGVPNADPLKAELN